MQKEVRRVWNEGRIKLKAKIEHLSKKWNKGVKLEGTWRGIRYGDQALRKKAEEENREINVNKEPIIYGKVETTEGENEILKLAPNFTTYKAVSEQDMETAAEVMNAKIKMELRARKEREQKHGEWRWNEEWEEKQQEKRTVYSPRDKTMKFEKRRVTDMKTCRRIIPPTPLSTEETIVLKNMTDRIRKETKEYITKSCNKKGMPKKNNLTKDETKNLRSLEKRVKSGEVVIM